MSDLRKSFGRNKKNVIVPAPLEKSDLPADYGTLLSELKARIHQTRLKAALAVNASLVILYWEIGNSIVQRQSQHGWGAKVIDRLSYDLRDVFPDMKGFSPRNLKYMRAFALAWPDVSIVQGLLAQIPWFSNIALLEKLNETELRKWYAAKTIEHGWSQPVLCFQIASALHNREGKSANNFPETLPPPQSDMASQIFKDPYIFDFLGTDTPRRELDIEKGLVSHVEKFLLEMGAGFAFVGRQVLLEVGSQDFYVDLLFYHLKLRCYVIVELKTGRFEPGHLSQLTFYLNVVDDLLRHPDDKPSIGLLLVREKDQMVAEYCLRGYSQPVSISEWQDKITKSLPKELQSSLPSIEDIERELGKDADGVQP